MKDCRHCHGYQQTGEYEFPDGVVVSVLYKCQVCGQGEQTSILDIAESRIAKTES